MHTQRLRPHSYFISRLLIICLWLLPGLSLLGQTPSFSASGLVGENLNNPTSLQFGPDGRLYVSQQDGLIFAYQIERQAANQYVVSSTETIDLIQKYVPNHNDDGTANGTKQRQVTGILIVGTLQNPILYVASSDWRISVGVDSDLDTNSGVISRLTWVGNGINDPNGYWDKVDIVRGLPRSEENHATNGLQWDATTNTLYVMQGGHTNKGAPGNNFAQTPEYALSAALLSIDLDAIEAMSISGSGNYQFIYDIPTLDDPTRGTPGLADPGDPFGGNDGRNQARIVQGGPVQVYAPGFRNAYDVVKLENGRLYTFDNGPNGSWGGISPNCSNQSSEANSDGYGDGLHFISGPGYYGGHPNYTRADPENSGLYIYEKVGGTWSETASYDWMSDFPDPPVPVSMANPAECNYLIPAVENDALAIINASTNGMAEYRASNFNNALKGNILAASFSGDIFSFKLNAAGDQVLEQQSLFSGFGSQPLDVASQGDNEKFAGTVWAATYGSNSITVFEPNDFIECSGEYSISLDDDFDNYSNADEVDNGSDPCSAGSKPSDNDLDYISDLNDTDDDNDGILDVEDPFAIDPENGLATFLPISYDLFNYDPGEGFFGLGFTGLMQNGTTDYLTQFNEDLMAAGGAAGLLTVEEVPEGDAFQGNNSQAYAFQFGANIRSENGPFSIKMRMNGPFLGNNPGNFLSQGMFIGTGSQSDYLKFVITAQNGGGVEVVQETNDIANGNVTAVANILSATYIDLIIDVDPTSGMYITRYALNGGNVITLGGGLLNNSIAYAVQSESQALAIGIISTSNGPAPTFSATWDRIDVTGSGPSKIQIPNVEAAVGDANDQMNLHDYFDDNGGDENLTYSVQGNTTATIEAVVSSNQLVLSYPASPDSGKVTIRATDSDGYYVEQSFDVFLRTERSVLYRVNAGGGMKLALDDGPDWDADTVGNVSSYHGGTSNINGFDVTFFDASVSSSTPEIIFKTERWDPAAEPEMKWTFPAAISGIYEVRLYFANGFGGTSSPGQRVFHVTMEGDTLLNSYDIAADVGHLTGVCKTVLVPVSDGILDIEFLHLTENPLVNAIEILGPATSETNLIASSSPVHFFSQQIFSTSAPEVLTLSNTGARAITVSNLEISGTDADMFAHTFSGAFTIQPGGSQNVNVTFSPTSEGLKNALISIEHDGDNNPLEVGLTGEAILSGQQVLFRVNAGGPELTAADSSDPNWSQDDANGVSPYLAGVTNIYSVTDAVSLHPTVPPSAPISMFQKERWSPDPSQKMGWDFPVAAGTPVEIRLYFAEIFLTAQSNQNNPRIFDIEVDGAVPTIFDDLNIFEEVGHDVGIMKAFQTTSDGNIDIDFIHGTNNPAIKGLEIIDLSTPVENLRPELLATDDQTNDEQDVVSLQIVAQDPDGDELTYSATDLPPGLDIDETTGEISGAVNESAALGSPYQAIIFVNDGFNPAVSDTFTWVINAPGLPTEICINTGGGEYTTGEGQVFLADDYFSGTNSFFSTNLGIDNTTDDALFQSERYGIDFSYAVPLADGTYLVDIYFAEIYHGVNNNGGVGSRVFSVDIEGENALTNYDIFAAADEANGDPTGNGELYAVIETFEVTVSGGTLDIRLYKGNGGSDNAKIAAICARPADPNNPPVVQNPGDQENVEGDSIRLMIAASDTESDVLAYVATGLPPGLSIGSENGLISGVIEDGAVDNSPYSVTVSVDDGHNPPVDVTFTWTVLGNNPPVVSNPGTQTNTEGDDVNLAIVATDDEGDILTYEATNLPPGLNIGTSNGVITGTVDAGAAVNSPYSVSVAVSDGVNEDVTISFSWIIEEPNGSPVVDNPGDQTNMEGESVTLAIAANDPEDDELEFGATGLPGGLSINSETGVISGDIDNDASENSPYTVEVTVDDGVNPIVSISFDWNILDNLPPVVTTPDDQENLEGEAVSLTIAATDDEDDDLEFGASGLPAGLSINSETGEITGDVDNDASENSPYTVEVTVDDGMNPVVTISFDWYILDNLPPVVTTPDDQENVEGDAVSLTIAATDAEEDDLEFQASNLPPGLFINANTGEISGTISEGAATNSPYSVSVSVDDGLNPAVVINFNWVVEEPNQGPVVTNPGDQENTEGEIISLMIVATDVDNDVLSYAASGLPDGLSINANTGEISGTISYSASDDSPYLVEVSVSDGDNPEESITFTWVVNDNLPPMVTSPGDQENDEGDVVFLAIQADDAEGDGLTYGASGLPYGLGINPATGEISGTVANATSDNSPYTIVITVDDGINDPVSVEFEWVIIAPNQPPVITNPGDQRNTEGDVVALDIEVEDADNDLISYSASNLPPGLFMGAFSGEIRGRISDGASNNSPYRVTISVFDGSNPTERISFLWYVSPPSVASAYMTINENGGIGASTYGNNSFMITNTSTNDLKLTKLIIDLSTSLLPDVVFDPVGAAGDVVGKCFTPNNGSADVGVLIPLDACTEPFSAPRDGGYDVMSINFSNFDPTESFGFSVDIDPTSIQGATGSGVAGSISGLELSGATIWAIFENGDTIKSEPYYAGTDGSSKVCLETPIASAPTIEVLNLPAPDLPLKSVVTNASQTIRLGATAGTEVALLVVEAGLFLSEVNGNGFDIDPFEGNQALNIREFTATVGANGTVDIPVNLNLTEHPDWETGFNYLMAVVKNEDNCAALTSDIWVLKLEDNQSPSITAIEDQSNEELDIVSLQVEAEDPDGDELMYAAINLPPGLVINSTTGEISGTIAEGAADNSPYAVTISVEDGVNPAVETSFDWYVDENQPPIITAIADQNSEELETISLQIEANDPEGDELTYSASNLPPGLALNSVTGEIAGTVSIGASENSPYAVTVFVDDGINAAVETSFNWYITVGSCVSPTIDAMLLVDADADTAMYALADGDTIDLAVLTHSISVDATVCGMTPDKVVLMLGGDTTHVKTEASPPYALFGDLSGNFNPWPATPGEYTIKATPFVNINGQDVAGISLTLTVVIVNNVNLPPIVPLYADRQSLEWENVQVTLSASDPENDPLTFSATNLPPGLSIADSTGIISGAIEPGASANNPYQVVISVSDGANTVDRAFTWYIGAQPCFGPEVTGFILVNADANIGVSVLEDGAEINLADLNHSISVQANVCGFSPDSIIMELSGDTLHAKTEVFPPYALFGDFSGNFIPWPATPGEYTITATPYTQLNGSTVTGTPLSITITIIDQQENRQPTLSPISSQFNYEWEDVLLNVVASDPDNDALTFVAFNLPPGLSINSTTGVISGTVEPGASSFGPYAVNVYVYDGQTLPVGTAFEWTIGVQPCIAPEITGFVFVNSDANTDVGPIVDGDTIKLQDLTYAFTVRATVCGFLADSIVMTLSGDTLHSKTEEYGPYALFGDFNGDFSAWPATAGNYTITATPYTQYDGQVFQGTPVSIDVVVEDAPNLPPVISSITNQFNYEWQYASLNINASDPNGDPLTYRADNLPPGLSINPSNGQIQGTIRPGAAAGSAYLVTIGVNDGENPTVTTTFYWIVGTQNCVGPEVTSFSLLNATANTVMYELADGDTIDLSTLNHTISVLASTCGLQAERVVMTLGGDTTHTRVEVNPPYTLFGGILGNYLSWPVSPGDYTLTATPYLTINGQETQGEALSINIVVIDAPPANRPPVLGLFVNQMNMEGDVISLASSASDPDGDVLTFRATNLPLGLSIDPATGLIYGGIQVGAASVDPYGVTVYVSDGEYEVSQSFLWEVEFGPCVLPEVQDFYLVNADLNTDMYALLDGDVIDLSLLTNSINIRVDLCGATPDSLVMTVVEDTLHHQVDVSAPYAVYGDIAGNFNVWPASAGEYTMTATPYVGGVPAGTAKSIKFTVTEGQPCLGEILFVVGNLILSSGDQAAKKRLEDLGFNVEVMHAQDALPIHATGKSLVMISSTVFSAQVGTKFSDVAVPVMCWEAYVYDDLGLTGNFINFDYQFSDFQSSVEITDPFHPMASGLSGTFPIITGENTMPWGKPNANAAVVATVPGEPSKALLFGYEAGVQMVGRIAPARRVGIFLHSSTTADLNNAGWKLFEQALFWSLGCETLDNNEPPTVEITAPLNGTQYESLETISIAVDAQDPDGSLSAVEFYANGQFIGIDPEFPYEMDWAISGYGTHVIQATAIDAFGETASTSISVEAIQPEGCAGEVLFVVKEGPLQAGDLMVKQRLESMGFTVQTLNDDASSPFYAIGKSLVMISSSVDSWEVGDSFKNVNVPVLSYEAFLHDNMGMTGDTEEVDFYWAFDQTYLVINNPSHPMAAGYSGFVWSYAAAETMVWGKPAPSAVKVASIVGQVNQTAIFGYETGSLMVDMNAPARRVGFFMQLSGAPYMTTGAWNLFESAVYWAVGCSDDTVTPTGPSSPARMGQPDDNGREFVLNTKVYPNPTEGNATLSIEHPESGTVTIQISDMVGKVYYRTEISKEFPSVEVELPTQQLARGTYIIQINHPTFNKTERLVKLRDK